jgi:hypothetical protein
MTAQKFANFPEREVKVVIGPHINAPTIKALSKLSIGTYEMSVTQQERGQQSAEAGRLAMNALARELALLVSAEETRDYLCSITASSTDHGFHLWITPPFESGQASHLAWCKYTEVAGDKKLGISFKLATSFTSEDLVSLLKQAQKNAQILPVGEPYVLKGNPPPRFQKKAASPPADGAKVDTPSSPSA